MAYGFVGALQERKTHETLGKQQFPIDKMGESTKHMARKVT